MKKFKCIAANTRKKKNEVVHFKSTKFYVIAKNFGDAILKAERKMKEEKFIFESLKLREV